MEKFDFSLTANELHRDNLKDAKGQVGAKIASMFWFDATDNKHDDLSVAVYYLQVPPAVDLHCHDQQCARTFQEHTTL